MYSAPVHWISMPLPYSQTLLGKSRALFWVESHSAILAHLLVPRGKATAGILVWLIEALEKEIMRQGPSETPRLSSKDVTQQLCHLQRNPVINMLEMGVLVGVVRQAGSVYLQCCRQRSPSQEEIMWEQGTLVNIRGTEQNKVSKMHCAFLCSMHLCVVCDYSDRSKLRPGARGIVWTGPMGLGEMTLEWDGK